MPVYLSRRWRRQPTDSFTVDWSNPLAQAIGLYVAWNGANPRLRFRSQSNVLVNSPASFDGPGVKNSLRGIQTQVLGVTTTAANNPDVDLGAVPSMTELSVIAVLSQGATINALAFATRTNSGSPGFDLVSGLNGVAGRATFRILTSTLTGGDAQPTATFNDAFTHTYYGTWASGNTVKLYVDKSVNLATGPSISGTVTHPQNLKIANRGGTRWTGFAGLLLVGTKQNINAGLELLENPWQIFVPRTNAIISLSSKQEFLLDASAGTYSLVGSDATLVKALSLSADAGAYNLTGEDATLLRGIPLSADAGSYNVNGQNASLIQARSVSADAGSYQIDGQAAAFIRTYNLLADAGAFNITGSAASLFASQTLLAGSGSYVLTGAPASLIKFSTYPDPGDVRAGVTYGPGGIYTGTLTVGGKVIYIFDD